MIGCRRVMWETVQVSSWLLKTTDCVVGRPLSVQASLIELQPTMGTSWGGDRSFKASYLTFQKSEMDMTFLAPSSPSFGTKWNPNSIQMNYQWQTMWPLLGLDSSERGLVMSLWSASVKLWLVTSLSFSPFTVPSPAVLQMLTVVVSWKSNMYGLKKN